jgi:hypothetical protein
MAGNLLTDEKTIDPVTGYPSLKALLCKVRPKLVGEKISGL